MLTKIISALGYGLLAFIFTLNISASRALILLASILVSVGAFAFLSTLEKRHLRFIAR